MCIHLTMYLALYCTCNVCYSKEIDLPEALRARLNVKSQLSRPTTTILSAVQEHLASSIQFKFDTFLQVTLRCDYIVL